MLTLAFSMLIPGNLRENDGRSITKAYFFKRGIKTKAVWKVCPIIASQKLLIKSGLFYPEQVENKTSMEFGHWLISSLFSDKKKTFKNTHCCKQWVWGKRIYKRAIQLHSRLKMIFLDWWKICLPVNDKNLNVLSFQFLENFMNKSYILNKSPNALWMQRFNFSIEFNV